MDVGGVLVQWVDFSERDAWAEARGMTGQELFDRWFEAVGPGWEGGRSEEEIHRRMLASVGASPDELPELLRVLHAHEALDPKLAEFLQKLRPRYRTGIITNAGPSARAALGRKFALDTLVDEIVVSAEEGCSKPDMRIYLRAATRLGVTAAECVFVDDKDVCLEGARQVGMTAIRYENSDQVLAELREVLGVAEVAYDAAGAVVVDGDRVLVLDRPSRSEVRLPKGHVEDGEDIRHAAVRETVEETGYGDVVIDADLGVQVSDFDVFPPEGQAVHVVRTEYFFRMGLISRRQVERSQNDEQFVPVWMPPDEALSALTFEVEREWVRRAVELWSD